MFLQRPGLKVLARAQTFRRQSVMCFSIEIISAGEFMRNHTKLFLTSFIASLGLTSIAFAADLPARTYTKAPVMPMAFAAGQCPAR
jgi:hypothetical protein